MEQSGILAGLTFYLPMSMKIISANLNGIRSAARKGFFEWLPAQDADVVCVQELKAQETDMTPELLSPPGYHGYFHYAEKKGYSGVGLYSRMPAKNVIIGFGNPEFDAEGRYVAMRFRRPDRDLGVLPVRLFQPGTAGSQVPLHGSFPAAPAGAEAKRTRNRHLRRLEHRAPAKST